MIHLLDIDPGNWRIDLAVSEAQKPFVSDRAKLLANVEDRLQASMPIDDGYQRKIGGHQDGRP